MKRKIVPILLAFSMVMTALPSLTANANAFSDDVMVKEESFKATGDEFFDSLNFVKRTDIKGEWEADDTYVKSADIKLAEDSIVKIEVPHITVTEYQKTKDKDGNETTSVKKTYKKPTRMDIMVYSGNDIIWIARSNIQVNTQKDKYIYNLGLAKGNYTVSIVPQGKVGSLQKWSTTATVYSASEPYAEKESNQTTETATEMHFRNWYKGYINTDGATKDYGDVESQDLWKIYLQEGHTYEVYFYNYEGTKSSNFKINDIHNNALELKSDIKNNITSEGYHFIRFSAPETGYFYYSFTSGTGKQERYAVKTEEITMNYMHRLYNPNTGEHFYTANEGERDYLIPLGWQYEGIAFTAPETSTKPVYRLYNPNTGDHHYTPSPVEKAMATNSGWQDEGIAWYSDDYESTPIYRLYNPNATTGTHHYTISKDEVKSLTKLKWKDEGIAWYGL